MIKNEAEKAVLGALVLDGNAIDRDLVMQLVPADFQVVTHQLIFKAMLEIEGPIDIITVVNQLKNTNVKSEYVTDLLEATPTASNINYYAKIVKDSSNKNKLSKLAQYINENLKTTDSDQLVEKIVDSIDKLTATSLADSTESIGSVIEKTYNKCEAIQDNPDHIIGISTGYSELDKLTTGLQGGDLIIIAGRPAMGKSAIAGNFAENIALKKKKVLGFNLEMSKDQLGIRYLSSISGVPMNSMKTGNNTKLDWENINDAVGKHYNLPYWINDTPSLTVNQIRAKCRQHQREHGLDLVTIDYMQLIHGQGQSREQEVANISRSLKALAKELNIPVICLAQLSRKCEERPDKRPMLSDLRESGSIEQDADIVMFVYREEVYNKCECPIDLGCTCSRRNTAEIIIAKQRQGSTGSVDLRFDKKISRFKEA
jgi:replicative DNA helicase